jgi:membrane fusion protein (multidrug efflux system)
VALSRPQKTGLWIGVAVVAGALLLLPRLVGGDAEAEPAAERPRGGDTLAVTVAPVSQRLLEDRVTTTGTLLPWEAVEVRVETAGRVVGINFREGASVRQGQTLVSLDTDVLRAQIEGARTRRDLARVQEGRYRELFEIGGLSRQQLDQAESEARVLDAELAQLSAEVRRRQVVAPFSGTIGLRQISAGAYVSPGDAVATLRITNRLRLEFTVPERYLGQITEGQAVRFAVPGQDDDFVATVYAIEPFVDPATRAFTVRAEARNPGGVLQPGAFAEVRLVLDEIPGALLIPTASVITGADSTTVFVVEGGAAVPRAVTTGVRTADEVQVTSGLAPGDVVLTSGLNQVRPGQAVRAGGAFDPTRVRPEGAPERSRAYQAADGSP